MPTQKTREDGSKLFLCTTCNAKFSFEITKCPNCGETSLYIIGLKLDEYKHLIERLNALERKIATSND